MKKVINKKTGLSLIITILFMLITAQTAFSDSFVDEYETMKLKDFSFGAYKCADTKAVQTKNNSIGDSFIDATVVDVLKNFKFGQKFDRSNSNFSRADIHNNEDSFIDEYAVNALQDFNFNLKIKSCVTLITNKLQ